MRNAYFVVFTPLVLSGVMHFKLIQEKCYEALHAGDYKKAQEICVHYLNEASPQDVGLAKTQLAIAYYKDQEHEKAFITFLEALEIPSERSESVVEYETESYQDALKIYLEDAGLSPLETARKILGKFETAEQIKKDDAYLNFLIALSYANLGQYDRFFEKFYASYLKNSHHFLVYKAKAALSIKLYERAKTPEERTMQADCIIGYAQKAIELNPQDTSLYRMILGFVPSDKKAYWLQTIIQKLIDQNIMIARQDIAYYNELAIFFQQYDLAQKFLDKARSWYVYSRVINEAQQHLNQQRTQSEE